MASKRKRVPPVAMAMATKDESEVVQAEGEVGRLVDSSQADDRRMIRLVKERPLLYARNNMPVASYYTQVKKLWEDVAQEMGWTVADVRRKWSHVRNSYSRHLRNEMYGVRTGRGRMVSRWYLADELSFLRDHMATDTRPSRYSFTSIYSAPSRDRPPSVEPVDLKPFLPNPWFTALAGQAPPDPMSDSFANLEESRSPTRSFEPDENAAYFQFFRGIYNDYQELPAKKQRMFRRECLNFLHQLLDGEELPSEEENNAQQYAAINLSSTLMVDEEESRDVKVDLTEKLSESTTTVLPH